MKWFNAKKASQLSEKNKNFNYQIWYVLYLIEKSCMKGEKTLVLDERFHRIWLSNEDWDILVKLGYKIQPSYRSWPAKENMSMFYYPIVSWD